MPTLRTWLRNGWCDYFTPQLYWKIDQTAQSYPALLHWWAEQNVHGRHLWPGNYVSRVGDNSKSPWNASEVLHQIEATRNCPGATGNVHFSMVALLKNQGGLADTLSGLAYTQSALVPASPWLGHSTPARPLVTASPDSVPGETVVHWSPDPDAPVWQWVVQTLVGQTWQTQILPGDQSDQTLVPHATEVAVSAVDRLGNQGPPTIIELNEE